MLDRRPIGDVSPDWWFEESARPQSIYLSRRIGPYVEQLRNIEIPESEIDRVWPKPKVGQSASGPPQRKVPQAELEAFLKQNAARERTYAQVKELAKSHFQGRHFADRSFDEAWREVPQRQKRGPGDTDRTLCRKAKS